MKTFLARMRAENESAGQIVGIFNASSADELFWLIDECVSPSAVEVTELKAGGIYWEALETPVIPVGFDEHGKLKHDPMPANPGICETWETAFLDYGDGHVRSWQKVGAALFDEDVCEPANDEM